MAEAGENRHRPEPTYTVTWARPDEAPMTCEGLTLRTAFARLRAAIRSSGAVTVHSIGREGGERHEDRPDGGVRRMVSEQEQALVALLVDVIKGGRGWVVCEVCHAIEAAHLPYDLGNGESIPASVDHDWQPAVALHHEIDEAVVEALAAADIGSRDGSDV